jgi:hypothetical protein
MKMADTYAFFGRYAQDTATCAWHSDFLSVALCYGHFSYVRNRIEGMESIEKAGRPYLHILLDDYSICTPESLDMISILLSKGGRPDHEFNFRTTWEYLLIKIYKEELQAPSLVRLVLLFLGFDADPNQRIKFPDYKFSTLHILLSKLPVHEEQLEVVLLELLKNGADPNTKDLRDLSVIQLA